MALLILTCLIFLVKILLPDINITPYHKKLAAYQKQRKNLEAITVGNSHSKGFHFLSLGLKGIHFYDNAGDIEEVRLKVDVLIKELPNLKYIFIPVSVGILNVSQRNINDNYLQRQVCIVKNLPMSITTFLFSFEASIIALINKFFPMKIISYKMSYLINSFIFKGQNTIKTKGECFLELNNLEIGQRNNVLIEDGVIGGYYRVVSNPEKIRDTAKNTIAVHLKMIKDSLEKEPDIVEHNRQRLINVANKLSKREGKLILVVMPMTKDYYQSTPIQALVPEHFAQLAQLEKHPNIEVYDFHDYFYKKTITDKNYYFHDGDHLAITGAIEFSNALKLAMEQ